MQTDAIETRSYRILGVLGKGGFGKVYRARLEGAAGFTKDVAIKLLTDAKPGEDVLQRFRDESRILGLLRDRALVSVDPPTQLNGRWAIVMECVDGVSCRTLLKAHGALPVPIALEIVQEVARALDHAYRAIGPEGAPLELVHRDLKPDNLQVTPQGQVKILDFGTARARFGAREAETTRSIAGTYGYIAPERLLGIDTPAGDVYSLGMLLHRLLTAGKAEPRDLERAVGLTRDADPPRHAALQLAKRMTHENHEQRPNAAAVEDACQELRREHREPQLRHWAPVMVAPLQTLERDELVGRTLSSTFQVHTDEVSVSRSRSMFWLAALGMNAVVAAVMVGLVLVVSGVVVWAALREPAVAAVDAAPEAVDAAPEAGAPAAAAPDDPAAKDAAPDDAAPGTTPPDAGAAAPDTTPPDAGAAAPAADPPANDPPSPAPDRPAPDRPPAPRPEPAPPSPAPAAAPAASVTIRVTAPQWGADVRLDGVSIGKTPVKAHAVAPGTYDLLIDLSAGAVRQRVSIGPGQPNHFVWSGTSWDNRLLP